MYIKNHWKWYKLGIINTKYPMNILSKSQINYIWQENIFESGFYHSIMSKK